MQYMRITTVLAALAIASPAAAQGRKNSDHIPPGQRPPAGMCRIWVDGVPPGHQPAPTDCVTANARRPANARVIYGDDVRNRDNGRQTGSIFLPTRDRRNGDDDRDVNDDRDDRGKAKGKSKQHKGRGGNDRDD
jgi:hypothetical protein